MVVKKDDLKDQKPKRVGLRSTSAAQQPPLPLLPLGSTSNSTKGVKPKSSSMTNKTADNVSELAADTVGLQLNDAETAPQAVPAPAPTAETGGTNNDDDKNVAPEPPAADRTSHQSDSVRFHYCPEVFPVALKTCEATC